jgi:hypothetical protein
LHARQREQLMPHCSEFAWRLCRHVNDERVEHPPSSLNARRSHGYKRGCRKCRAGNRLYRAWVQAWPECSTLSQRVYCKWTRKINAISAASRSPDTSTTEQCSCAVTIKASKIGRRALNQHSTAGSIAFGTDRSLRHRVSSDPISQPQTKSPSIHLPPSRPAGVVLSPACPVLSSFYTLPLDTLHTPPTTPYRRNICCTSSTTATLCQHCSQGAYACQSRIRSLTGTLLVRWLDSAAHPRIPPHR